LNPEESAKSTVEHSGRQSSHRTAASSGELNKNKKRGKHDAAESNGDIFDEEDNIYQSSPTKRLFLDNPESFQIKLSGKNLHMEKGAHGSKKKQQYTNNLCAADEDYFPKENKGKKNRNIYQTPQQSLGAGKHNTSSSESISSPEKVPIHDLRKKGNVRPFVYGNPDDFEFNFKK